MPARALPGEPSRFGVVEKREHESEVPRNAAKELMPGLQPPSSGDLSGSAVGRRRVLAGDTRRAIA
jgi:hypothetical protein